MFPKMRFPSQRRRMGPGGCCICPYCGYRRPHFLGVPCYKFKCPECGTMLVREEQ